MNKNKKIIVFVAMTSVMIYTIYNRTKNYHISLDDSPSISFLKRPETINKTEQVKESAIKHSNEGAFQVKQTEHFDKVHSDDIPERHVYFKKVSNISDPETSERKVVIVLAYMHTGSTFLGSILQNHEHTFYEYENLRSLMYSTRAGKKIYFLNGTIHRLRPNPDVTNVHHNVDHMIGADAIRKMITCQHRELDLATLANRYIAIDKSVKRDWKSFFRCQERHYGNNTKLTAESALKYVDNPMLRNTSYAIEIVKKCLPLLTKTCKESKVVAEKFIRMTMEMAKLLLEQFKHLKIIHLFRDPRAMLDSQVRKENSGARTIHIFNDRAQYMCKQMTKDRKLAKELLERFPDQIMTVRYEDMIDFPTKTIKTLFNFIDIPFTKADELFLNSNIRSRSPVNGSMPLNEWRKHIGTQYLNIVDGHCSSLYKEFGYVPFKTFSEVKDQRLKDHIEWM